jgi:molybdopterin converting factor small subunit
LLSADETNRAALTRRGLCSQEHPAVSVELYGSLAIRSGQSRVALRADTIRTALAVLLLAQPNLARLLGPPETLAENHRFSINGRTITTDLDTPLKEGDHLILFSASVGG